MTRALVYSLLLMASLLLQACITEDPSDTQVADQQVSKPVEAKASPATGSIDPESGLVIDEQWQLVKAHCGVCHSTRLITQNRGDREAWLSLIRWMQESQGLWSFDPATEAGILDYLASNYAPLAAGRRTSLDESLLPPNPYKQ